MALIADIYIDGVQAVPVKFVHILLHALLELGEVLRVAVLQSQVSPGQFLRQDIVEHRVLIVGYRLVYAALLKGIRIRTHICRRNGRIGPRRKGDGIAALSIDADHRNACGSALFIDQIPILHAMFAQFFRQLAAEGIITQAGQHAYVPAKFPGCGSLISCLAARIGSKVVGSHGFAHRGHRLHVHAKIHVDAAHANNHFFHRSSSFLSDATSRMKLLTRCGSTAFFQFPSFLK